ncbi:ubiquinone biosynthesis accessory factor UbiJ [Methylotenera sp. L2L1]|uniref:ubiquinone biosynthesis accessory factor UbiJ n=1 Tax=Methylotenera sp. L2L1 TaxID=1502770 RepID=UPI001F2669CA|nr:SCP2 sterol-binding domain-containing protein [Methylotenera sp. L2L1]
MSTHVLQHLIAQNTWACSLLQPFAGKSVRITIAPVSSALVILEDGSLAMAGETNIPDASINIAPSLLLRLLAKDEAAKLQIEISGDTHLATALAKVFSHLRWDYEDDLSKLVGDVPANKIGSFARGSVQTIKDTGLNIASMLSEYWQEEKPMLAKKRHVEQFNSEVDRLRSDVERFEKRLQKLAKLNDTKLNSIEANKSQTSETSTASHNQVTDSVK